MRFMIKNIRMRFMRKNIRMISIIRDKIMRFIMKNIRMRGHIYI